MNRKYQRTFCLILMLYENLNQKQMVPGVACVLGTLCLTCLIFHFLGLSLYSIFLLYLIIPSSSLTSDIHFWFSLFCIIAYHPFIGYLWEKMYFFPKCFIPVFLWTFLFAYSHFFASSYSFTYFHQIMITLKQMFAPMNGTSTDFHAKKGLIFVEKLARERFINQPAHSH